MNFAALRSVFLAPALALALTACAQNEPPVPEFETITYDLREPAARFADAEPSIPLPTRKPAALADASGRSYGPAVVAAVNVPREQHMISPVPLGPDGLPVASAQASASTQAAASAETIAASETGAATETDTSSEGAPSRQYASVTRYFKRWLPDFNKITDCPNGITCQAAFAN